MIMTPADITHCINTKQPILHARGKVAYCLICRKYALNGFGIEAFLAGYNIKHNDCCKKFDTVAEHYVITDPKQNILINNTDYESTRNEIVSEIIEAKQAIQAPAPVPNVQADMALIKQVRKLEELLEEAEGAYHKEKRSNDKILGLLDSLRCIAVALFSDKQYEIHKNLFDKINEVLDDDLQEDDSDE
jgi:hypothetical protein